MERILKFVDFSQNENQSLSHVNERVGEDPKRIDVTLGTLKKAKFIIDHYKSNNDLWNNIINKMKIADVNIKNIDNFMVASWYLSNTKIKATPEQTEAMIEVLANAKTILSYYKTRNEDIWNSIERRMYIKNLDPNKTGDLEKLIWYFEIIQKNKYFIK